MVLIIRKITCVTHVTPVEKKKDYVKTVEIIPIGKVNMLFVDFLMVIDRNNILAYINLICFDLCVQKI